MVLSLGRYYKRALPFKSLGPRKFIQQGCIQLTVKAFITKDLYFKENTVVLNFLFIKES